MLLTPPKLLQAPSQGLGTGLGVGCCARCVKLPDQGWTAVRNSEQYVRQHSMLLPLANRHTHVQAVEDVKEKIKSVLPTANMFDPASLQVRPVICGLFFRIAGALGSVAMHD